MKSQGGSGKKRWLFYFLAPLFCLTVFAGALLFTATRGPSSDTQQPPNSVAAFHANRKLRILTNSIKYSQRGFIRLTEVEINSLIQKEQRKNATNQVSTNLVSHESVVKGTVFLTSTNFTLVTWHKQKLPLFSLTLPLQRTFVLAEGTNKVSASAMKLGKLPIPRRIWSEAEGIWDPGQRLVYKYMPWLKEAVASEMSQNELSKLPELKLYSYMPSKLKR